MFLTGYVKNISRPKCNPSSESVHCIACLNEDITEVLPYLNSVLGGTEYFRDPPEVMFRHYGKIIKVGAREIAINALEDRDAANQPARSSPPRWQREVWGRNIARGLQRKTNERLPNIWRDLILIDGSGQRAQKFSGRHNPYAAVIHSLFTFEAYLIKMRDIQALAKIVERRVY